MPGLPGKSIDCRGGNVVDKGDVVIITGANSGTGKATALELARTGAQVVMVCRSQSRGEAALAEVRSVSKNNSVSMMLCDLASIKDIRRFVSEFCSRFSSLSVLINNAGLVVPRRQVTKDGFELQFGVNHLGHFLLTNLLLDMIMKSKGRIVTVASGAHKIGRIHFNDVNLKKNYRVFKAYAQAKLANILFTYELDRRLEGTGVTANCLHPGAVATNIAVNRDTGFGTLVARLMQSVFLTPAQGAETIIYLATSPEVQGVSGKYYYRKKPVKSSPLSYDIEIAKRLWNISEEMTGLNESSL